MQGLLHQGIVVVDGGDDFDAFLGSSIRQDDRIRALFFTHHAERAAHVLRHKTFDLHASSRLGVLALARPTPARSDRVSAHVADQLESFVVGYFVVRENVQLGNAGASELGHERAHGAGDQQDRRFAQRFLAFDALKQ